MIAVAFALVLVLQEPPAPAAPRALTASDCKTPDLPDRASLSPDEANRIGDEARVFAECISAYIEVRRQAVAVRVAEVQAESRAVAEMADEANNFVARFNAWQTTSIAQPAPTGE